MKGGIPRSLIVTCLVGALLVPTTGSIIAATPRATSAGEPAVLWTRQFGTSGRDYADDAAIGARGAVHVVGSTLGRLPGKTRAGFWDVFVRKYSPWGKVRWTRQFGTPSRDHAEAVAVDARGAVYVVGFTTGRLPGQRRIGDADAFVRKYSPWGKVRWTRQFGTASPDRANAVAVDARGAVYVAGSTLGRLPGKTSAGFDDAFVRKYSPGGKVLWTRQFGTKGSEEASAIVVDASGGVYVAGTMWGRFAGQKQAGNWDAFVRKYSRSGKTRWTRQFGSSDDDGVSGCAIGAGGAIYVSGSTSGTLPGRTSAGLDDAFVRKFGPRGAVRWTRQFGTSDEDSASDVGADASGTIYVVGHTGGSLAGSASTGSDIFIREYGSAGGRHWTHQSGTSRDDAVSAVAVDVSGGLYVTGSTLGTFAGQKRAGASDAFVRKYGPAPTP